LTFLHPSFMSILFVTIVHLSSFKPRSHSQSHFLTTMPKATTKKLGPRVQRVVWRESETTRGTISRSVKVKHKSSPLRPSPAKPSTSQHATPMDIDFDFDPNLEPPTSKVGVKIMLFYLLCMTFQSFPQSQNDYLREWLPKRSAYLHQILSLEAPPENRLCSQCLNSSGNWRCLECMGTPIYCMDCC
jgi:hypothetical protein